MKYAIDKKKLKKANAYSITLTMQQLLDCLVPLEEKYPCCGKDKNDPQQIARHAFDEGYLEGKKECICQSATWGVCIQHGEVKSHSLADFKSCSKHGDYCSACFPNGCADCSTASKPEKKECSCGETHISDYRDLCPYCEGDRTIANCSHSRVKPI